MDVLIRAHHIDHHAPTRIDQAFLHKYRAARVQVDLVVVTLRIGKSVCRSRRRSGEYQAFVVDLHVCRRGIVVDDRTGSSRLVAIDEWLELINRQLKNRELRIG
jgi:hypothetical protein